MPHAPPLASAATMAHHAYPTMGGIATITIAVLPETYCSPAIPAIPSLPAAVSTGSSGPHFFDLYNNDLYTPSYVAILDKI